MIAYDPNETFKVRIDDLDGGKPEAQRAVFKCRALSVSDTRKVRQLVVEARESKTVAEENRLLNEAIMLGVVGWENVASAFGADGLDAELSTEQKFTVAAQYPDGIRLSELEKKVLRSRQRSEQGQSASNAAGAASTSPATSAGSSSTSATG